MAVDKTWSKVVFETYSCILVDCIYSIVRGVSEFHAIVSNIKSMLDLFPDFEVKFVIVR